MPVTLSFLKNIPFSRPAWQVWLSSTWISIGCLAVTNEPKFLLRKVQMRMVDSDCDPRDVSNWSDQFHKSTNCVPEIILEVLIFG